MYPYTKNINSIFLDAVNIKHAVSCINTVYWNLRQMSTKIHVNKSRTWRERKREKKKPSHWASIRYIKFSKWYSIET